MMYIRNETGKANRFRTPWLDQYTSMLAKESQRQEERVKIWVNKHIEYNDFGFMPQVCIVALQRVSRCKCFGARPVSQSWQGMPTHGTLGKEHGISVPLGGSENGRYLHLQ